MQEGLDDHLDVMEHLKRSYADAEEVQAAERINALHEEITQLCRQDEQRITEVIQGKASRGTRAPAGAAVPCTWVRLMLRVRCAAWFGLTCARAGILHECKSF